MFDRLRALLKSPPAKPEPLGPVDAQLAIGTLLVRVAMADQAYLFQEVEQIDKVLANAFGLKPLEAAKLRAKCETFNKELPDDADLARIVHDGIDYDHRLGLIEGLWRIAKADGFTHESEASRITAVAGELGIAQADVDAARERPLVR